MNLLKWFSSGLKYEKVGFEDIKYAITNSDKYIIMNTLDIREQDLLIKNTITADMEEQVINSLIEKYLIGKKTIIIYGKNDCDESVTKKYNQILGLGFSEVFIYSGGLFDWLLLQEIYGSDEFPTTRKCKDLLKYRPEKRGKNSIKLIEF